MLAARAGGEIIVTAVSARDRNKDRGLDLSGCRWHDDARALADDADVDVVVELIGGSEGVALELVRAALGAGKSVVTANKALLAHHGTELARLAEHAGVAIAYEAAVAGGIPVIKAIREGLAANHILRVYGILNGTCNYILSTMRESGRNFEDVLAEAQELGYAEADPAFDIDGIDAAHKLAILTSVAFGCPVDFEGVYTEGIGSIAATDIVFAEELGYRIKLLAVARRTVHGIEQRVHPCMVPIETPIAHVDGVFNAVVAEGNNVDRTVYEGRGAGAGPTASAVVADIIDLCSGRTAPTFGVLCSRMQTLPRSPMSAHEGSYYVRLMVADLAAALRDAQVSIVSVLQRGRSPDEPVPVVIITHDTVESSMTAALDHIARLDTVIESPIMIRIEHL